MTAKFVGRSVPRLEDRPLLLGQGRFAADISFPGQWCMRVVRSPVAHGKLLSIDAGAALKLPGVHAVWTAKDVAQAHAADLAKQDTYGVKYLKYWVDEKEHKVFCLVEAPDADTADRKSVV